MNIETILEWFQTVPGLFVTGGIILLLIALIIFMVTSPKKSSIEEFKEEINEDIQINDMMVDEPVAFENIDITEPVMTDLGLENINEIKLDEPMTNSDVVQPSFEIPETNDPIIFTPENEFKEEVSFEVPEMNETFVEDTKLEETVIDLPIINFNEEVKPTIYGGNDPLEKTVQFIPVMEEIHPVVDEVKEFNPFDGIEIPTIEPVEEEKKEDNTFIYNSNLEIVEPIEVETESDIEVL